MLCSLATKAGAMAWRRGAQSGRGKVACVHAYWEGLWEGLRVVGWGGTFGARGRKLPAVC